MAVHQARRVVVFGGSGYVGSHICRALLGDATTSVLSVSRSGKKNTFLDGILTADQHRRLEYLCADVFDQDAWAPALDGATAVCACIGAAGKNDFMERMNGDANVLVFEAAAKAGVERACFVSAGGVDSGDKVTQSIGYFVGKRKAEDALAKLFPSTGVVLRPGVVSGKRPVGSGSATLPLDVLMAPVGMLLKTAPIQVLRGSGLPLFAAALTPPTDVELLAAAAKEACVPKESSSPSGQGFLVLESLDIGNVQTAGA